MRRPEGLRRPATVLLALYGVLVAVVVFWPSPVDRGSRGLIDRLLDLLHGRGLPRAFGYDQLEFTANIAMFVPLGLLLGLVLGRRFWWAAAVACVGLSASIELVQHLALPDRYATVRDVVANSYGGVIGALFAGALLAVVGARRTAETGGAGGGATRRPAPPGAISR